jgi:hypothetical protein
MLTNSSTDFACHVCGANLGDFAPWGEDGQCPTFAICDCCGVEFGYEDCQVSGVLRYRARWLSEGAKWFNPKAMPIDWSLDMQLLNIPLELPRGIRSDLVHI